MSKIEVTMLYHDRGTCDQCGDSSDTWEYSIYVDGELARTYKVQGVTENLKNSRHKNLAVHVFTQTATTLVGASKLTTARFLCRESLRFSVTPWK